MVDEQDEGKYADLLLHKIKRGMTKVCHCYGEPAYVVDDEARKVFCAYCGAEVDPFTAMMKIANLGQRYIESIDKARNEIKELEGKRRRTRLFRDLESSYLGPHGMMPCCPECGKAFEFEHIGSWTSREWYEKAKSNEGGGVEGETEK